MPNDDPTLPRLAQAGEVRGFNIAPGLLRGYKQAMSMAAGHPEFPVIVEEFTYGGPVGLPATDDAVQEGSRKAAVQAAKSQMQAVNDEDRASAAAGAPFPERYHVGYVHKADEHQYVTFMVFYPEGRPVRRRKAAAERVPDPVAGAVAEPERITGSMREDDQPDGGQRIDSL